MPTFPPWWDWDLRFTEHAYLRMEERGLAEIDVRAMLERATAIERGRAAGRFAVRARHMRQRWVVIVEPYAEAESLVVVTLYEVIE